MVNLLPFDYSALQYILQNADSHGSWEIEPVFLILDFFGALQVELPCWSFAQTRIQRIPLCTAVLGRACPRLH